MSGRTPAAVIGGNGGGARGKGHKLAGKRYFKRNASVRRESRENRSRTEKQATLVLRRGNFHKSGPTISWGGQLLCTITWAADSLGRLITAQGKAFAQKHLISYKPYQRRHGFVIKINNKKSNTNKIKMFTNFVRSK